MSCTLLRYGTKQQLNDQQFAESSQNKVQEKHSGLNLYAVPVKNLFNTTTI